MYYNKFMMVDERGGKLKIRDQARKDLMRIFFYSVIVFIVLAVLYLSFVGS